MADAEEKRQKIAADKLNTEFTVKFLKRELIVLNNVLVQTPFKVGDLLAIFPILEKIRPFVQDAMQTPPAPQESNHVVLSTKDEKKETN